MKYSNAEPTVMTITIEMILKNVMMSMDLQS